VQLSGTTTTTVALDTSVFHDYVLSGDPSGSYSLSVDGVVVGRGDLSKSSGASYVWFGDATGGPNAQAELTQLAFSQPEAHDLIGPTLGVSFSEVLDAVTVLGTQGAWHYGGHTYTLTPRSMSWTEAEAEAQRLGGHLVTINDEAEQAWVSETFGGWGGWYFWLGATDQAVEGTWVWASEQPVIYTNWAAGQPQSHSAYDWAYLGWDGRWRVTDNAGLGSGGWGVIEIDDAGADGDADGVPDILDPYPTNAANAFDLREAGTDASFGTDDDVLYTLRQTSFSGTGVSLRINEGTLAAGSYRFSVTPTIKDPAGNALDGNGDGSAGDAYQRYFTVAPLAGYQIEHSGFGSQAPLLELSEDPAGSGLAIGRALGRIDPANASDYSQIDAWRIEVEQGDRISVSVDSPASVLYPWLWLYDAAGNNVASDTNNGQGYGPDYDSFISNYRVASSGLYTLLVSKNYYVGEYRGAYELHVERARGIELESDSNYSNDSVGGANTLTLAVSGTHRTATVAGTIMAAEGSNTDEDFYNLGLYNAGNLVELSTRLPSDSTLVPKVTLLNASGQVLADEDGDATDGHARVTLAADGVIYARVEAISGSGSRGQYLLDVDISDPVPPRVTGVTGLPAVATEITLDPGALPSTQGWRYISNGRSEATLFSTDGSTLSQNSVGIGGYYAYYQQDNIVDASRPFELSLRARLLQEERASGTDHNGFGFAVFTGTQYVNLSFSPTGVQLSGTTTTTVALDTSVFHDYVLSGDPSGSYSLSVDGAVVGRGDLSKSSGASYVWFGDATGGPNAQAELTQLAFSQPEAHDLIGPTLGVSFSEVLDAVTVLGTQGAWHYGGHTYTLTPRSMSWTEAEAEAQRLGGHLVTINDEAEQAWVSETFGGWGGWYFWLGATDQAVEGTWVWASEQPVIYTNWAAGQPQSHSAYDWAYLGWDGRWRVTDNAGLGSGGWGVIEIDDAGADGDADGVPDILDPYPTNAANAFDLREAGTDASFGTDDDVLYTLRQTSFSGTGVSLRINEGTLAAGSYRFSVTPTIKDPAGNALDGNGDGSAGDAYQRYFTVAPLAGYQIEHSGFGSQAPLLELSEDPAGSGLAIGRALGRIDPANASDYSQIDAWRIEVEQGDRISVSVDSPASVLYPWLWLYDAAGNNVASDTNNGQGYGPDYDSFISNYRVASSGLYTLLVSKNYYVGEYRGAYELHVERARGIELESDSNYSNDSVGGANTLTLAVSGTHRTATVAGTIMAAEGSNTDEDFYNLGLYNAGNLVELSTRLPSDSTLVPKVTLLNASGQVLADEDGDATDGHARVTLAADGVIYARVEAISGSGSRGQYLLDVDISDPVPPRVTGVTGLPAVATEITLDPGALPSTQGWRYISNGRSEATLFSTDGSTLSQNSVGIGGYYAYYQQDNIVDASRPFELSLRARLLQEERASGTDHNGFGFAVFTGTQYVNLSFSPTGVQLSGTTTTTVALDTSVFHDYVLSGDPSGSYSLSVDGAVVGRGDLSKSSGASYVWFGDATGGPNAQAELTQLAFSQPEAHDLIGPTLGVSFSEVLDAVTVLGTQGAWHYGGHTYTLTPRSMSWTEAEAEAQRLGGHLVTINDEAEQAWVSETFGGWGGWYFWLGATDQAVEGTWVWASEQPVIYTNWAAGQPQSHSAYDWAYLGWDGRWRVTDNAGLGSGGWGVIEIDDAGADGDADGVPDILDPYPTNAANAFDLREAGTDASFGTDDDVLYTLRQTSFSGTGVSLRINEGTLAAGSYRFSVTPTIKDPAGNALDGNGDGSAGDAYQRYFTVAPLAGYQIEHSGFGSQAPLLELSEDPAGSGLAIGRALGRIDPANASDYSQIDAWRIEVRQGDRISVSVDSPASVLYPWLWLYDAAGNNVASDTNNGQGYGPDYDSFISNYRVASSGLYTLLVSKNYYVGEYRGAYELHVERARGIALESDSNYSNDSVGGANTLTLAVSGTHRTATVAGTIMAAEGSNTDEDFYNLGQIQAGETVFLSTRILSSSTLRPALELRNSHNVVVAISTNVVGAAARFDVISDDTYYVVVKGISGQGSRGQYLLDVSVWPTGEVSYADLRVPSVTLPADATSGETIRVGWTVENLGTGVTDRENWADRVVLSANEQYGDTDDIVLATVLHSGALAVGESYIAEADVQLPRGKAGSYWLFVQADSSLGVFEHLFDGNNVGQSAAQINVARTPAADLQVADLQARASAVSGRSFDVSWTVENVGDGTTGDGFPAGFVSEWTDRLVLSRNLLRADGDDTVLGTFTHSGELAAGGSYNRSETVLLPAGIEGDFFLYLQTDIPDRVYEEGREANNASSFRPLRIDVPRPDLLVSAVRSPASALNGADIQVSWDVENRGTLATGSANWTDRVILSTDAMLDDADVVLKSLAHAGALAVGESYAAQATVTIPTGYSMSEGEYFLFIETEAGGQIVEAIESNNATSSPIQLAFPAHVSFWDGGGDGVSWSDQNNWTRNTLPGADDTVTIDAPGDLTVVHQAGDDTVRRLTLDDKLLLSGGSLTTVEGLTVNLTLTLAGDSNDTVLRGTVTGSGSIVVSEDSGATLDGVTLDVVPLTDRGQLRVINGLTLQGSTITLLGDTPGTDRLLEFVGAQTLVGSGEVIFSGNASRNLVLATGGALTIGSGVSVHGGSGIVGQDASAVGADAELLVEGRISADSSGQEIFVSGRSVINHGTLGASNGGSLRLAGLAPNAGVLNAGADGLIRIDGDFSNTALGTVSVAVLGDLPQQHGRLDVGGTAHLNGTLDLELGGGTAPDYALSLPIVTYDAVEGSFSSVLGLEQGPGSNARLVNGAGLAPGRVEQAFTFDGANDYVEIPDSGSLHNGGAFTVELWVKPAEHRSSGLITHFDNAINGPGWGFNYYGTQGGGSKSEYALFIIAASYSDYTYLETPSGGVPFDQWTHIAGTSDGTTMRLYLNGEEIGSVPSVPVLPRAISTLIGAHQRGGSKEQFFKGSVDEVSMYSRSLSADEIRAIFDAGSAGKGTTPESPPPAGLVGWWSADWGANDFVSAFKFGTEVTDTGIRLVTKERELPDLQAFSVNAPSAAQSGDYVVVSWDVRNPGLDTGNVSWMDRVILSEDAVLDAGDVELGRVLHEEGLPKGESYREAGVYTLPIDSAGDFTIFVTADSDFAVFEGLKETNNSGRTAQPIHVTLRPVPNLHVSTIDVPAEVQPDERVRLSWTVTNSGAGNAIGPWIDEVYLSVDGSLNGATLLATVQHDGGMIPGASYTTFADVTLPRVADGNYRIVVSTDATHKVHERFDEGDNITVSAATVEFAHADLQVSAISAPDEQQLGYPVQVPVTWTVTNQGQRPTIPGAWQDYVFLSQNAVIGDADDVQVGSFLHNGTLQPGESTVQTRTVSLPFGVKGQYYLFVTADGANHVFEAAQESNNQSLLEAVGVLTAYADFAVDAVVVPADGGASGTPVQLSWKVSNVGIHETLGSSVWSDAIYLSADDVLDGADTLLATVPRGGVVPVGAAYTGRATPVLPDGIEGPFHIIVVADAGSTVYEDGRRDNNQGSQAIEVLPTPAPDLRVEPTIIVPPEGQPDRSVAISWIVTNSGVGNAEGSWVDRAYLSADGTLTAATPLGEWLHDGGLAVGASYSQTANLTLPRVGDGNYHIVIQTDAADAVFEGKPDSVAENNNLTVSASTVDMRHPDLKVPQVTVPAGLIQGFPVRLPISWTVTNDGARGSLAATWSDQIVLSRNAVLGDGDDQVVGSFTRFGSLQAGESYTRGETLTLPIGVSGDYRLFVRTDAQGQVYEGDADDANNASTSATVSLLTPFSDLVVDSVTAPSEALGRDTIQVSWTVRNQGQDATHAQAWSERIVLSSDATLDGSDLEIGRVTHVGDIAPGESYSESGLFTLPERLQGTFHVFVATDATAAVYEDGFEDNNLGEASTLLTVTPPPTPNLRVTRIAGPASGYAGDFARVTWTVTNDGAMPARGGWTDRVYLSVNGLAEGPVLATVRHENALGLNNIYSALADITLPDVVDGSYRFVVVTDTADEVFEGLAGEGATTCALRQGPLPSCIPTLR
jgi:hypothetical protein